LTTTSLASRDLDCTPSRFEQLDGSETDGRSEQIDQARDEQSYAHPVGTVDSTKAKCAGN
jgi:hypothetical protein